MLDVVYIVKKQDKNEELRYSLRSLSNIPHGKVFIVGYKPTWVKNVVHIPVFQNPRLSKYRNAHTNRIRACEDPRLSNDFIYFNDDFFVVKPVDDVPTYHRGNLNQFIRSHIVSARAYVEGAITTRKIMRAMGVREPYMSYELHIPMVLNKKKYLDLVKLQRNHNLQGQTIHIRTLYGNYYNIGGEAIDDVKIRGDGFPYSKDLTFISTSDESFAKSEVGRFIRSKFPEKSKYEV